MKEQSPDTRAHMKAATRTHTGVAFAKKKQTKAKTKTRQMIYQLPKNSKEVDLAEFKT